MPLLKTGHAAVAELAIDPFKWVERKASPSRVKIAKDLVAKYNIDQWLLSHATIIASVDTELANPKDKKSNYLIKPEYSIFVNNNGDSWERELLKKCYQTFVGSDNYLEHVQIESLSKGKIVDVALREVPFTKDSEGKDLTTLYVDILVATNKKHTDLIEKIKNGEYNAMSMGCGLAGTLITLPDGSFEKIENIKIGDEVLTHTGSSKRVTKLFNIHVSNTDLYALDYVGGNEALRLTGEHPILIATKENVRCVHSNCRCKGALQSKNTCYWDSKIRGRVKTKCNRDSDYTYDLNFVPISEVKKGDYLAKVFPTAIEDTTFSEDMCRLIGLYAGDGYIGWQWDSVTKEKKYPAYIGFCFGSKEKYLINNALLLIKKLVNKDTTITCKEVKERNGYYINVYDKDLSKLIYEECGEGAWGKKFSKKVMLLPKDKQLQIISGMIDTDGCFYEKTGSIHYSSVSESLINQLHLMLLRCGIGNSRDKVFRHGSGKKKIAHFQETISIEKTYSYLVPSLKNKLFGKVPDKTKEVCFFYKNYYMCPVNSATNLGFSGIVYNFSVEDDESYAVNDMAVHNCLIEYSQCSQCGRVAKDESEACEHIRYFKKNYFYDANGVKRIIAELCGRAEDSGSCKFIEASWVKKPAFEGAVLRNIVEPTEGLDSKFQIALGMPSYVAKPGDILRAASDMAAKLIKEIESQDKKEEPTPAEDDAGFPEAPADKETPVEEDTGEGVPLGDLAGAPAEEQVDVPVPEGDASVKEVKDLLKRQVLNEIRDELYKKQPGSKASPEDRPVGLENDTNNSLVKESSYHKIVKAAKEVGNDRLVNGLMILSNLKNWNRLRRYGYTRNDVVGMLHFIDKNASSKPLSKDIVKAIPVTKEGSDLKSFFTEIIVETGRRLSASEAKKLSSWKNILDKVK
jgi:hypothetical protein